MLSVAYSVHSSAEKEFEGREAPPSKKIFEI